MAKKKKADPAVTTAKARDSTSATPVHLGIAVRETRLVRKLIKAALAFDPKRSGWQLMSDSGDEPSLKGIINSCRKGCKEGSIAAISLLGLAAEHCESFLGMFDELLIDAIPDMLVLLENESSDVRLAAVIAIAKFRSHAPTTAVTAVASKIIDPDERLQTEVVDALWLFEADKVALSIQLLAGKIDETGPVKLRVALCELITTLGEEASDAVPAIVRAAISRSSDSKIAKSAAIALTKIDPDGTKVWVRLQESYARNRLFQLLRDVGPRGRELRIKLQKMVDAETNSLRLHKVKAEGKQCVVVLRGRESKPLVCDQEVPVLKDEEYDLVEEMARTEEGLDKDKLEVTYRSARAFLRRLETTPPWDKAIVSGTGKPKANGVPRRKKGDGYRFVWR